MRKIYLLILLGIFFSVFSYSQENPRIVAKTFFTNPKGLESAKRDFKIAEKYYRKGQGTFDEALKHYLKVYSYSDSSAAMNYKIAICYLWTSNKKASLPYLLKSTPETAKDYYLVLGRSYQYNLMFEKASEAYKKYLNSLTPWKQRDAKKMIDHLVEECEVSKSILQDSVAAFVINLGPVVNSYYDEYGSVLSNDQKHLYFTSRRPTKEPTKRVSRFKFKERILKANTNGIDKPVEWVDGQPNIDFFTNTGVAGYDKNSDKIFIYKGQQQDGKLYNATLQNGIWEKIRPFQRGINHLAYKETSISIDGDGTAYFVSNRRKGYGGKDIWMATKKTDKRYNKPVNLGNVINTPFDEEGVYVKEDGKTLFFSSKGHKGMGGYDVYRSDKKADGSWGDPVNMGYPINTAGDDLFYYPTRDSLVSLISTMRGDSYGGLDIYEIKLDSRIPFKLLGSVTDVQTGKVLPAAVNIYNGLTGKLINSVKVDSTAEVYMTDFDDAGNYFIQVDYKGYKSQTERVICPDVKHATVVQDFALEALRHPFTLVGRITDTDKGTPVKAALTFKLAADQDSVIGRAVSDSVSGNYTITFGDKHNMVIMVDADDYFSTEEPLSAQNEPKSVISKDIRLKRSKIDYTLTGRITDETGNIPVKAALSFFYPGKNDPFNIVISDSIDGKFTAVIDNPGPFEIEVDAAGYIFVNEVYQFPEGQTFTARNFSLKKIETGVKVVINNILFNSGKATLKPESFAELNKLVTLLQQNPNTRIEVSGHTDNVGSAAINKRISKARALAVKNYLVSRGIEQDRIEYQGYGFDQPIAPNDTEEGRAKNRRVELKFLN